MRCESSCWWHAASIGEAAAGRLLSALQAQLQPTIKLVEDDLCAGRASIVAEGHPAAAAIRSLLYAVVGAQLVQARHQ